MTKRMRSPATENETVAVKKRAISSAMENEGEIAITPPARSSHSAVASKDSKRGQLLERRGEDGWLTVEDLLTVPMEYVLRQVPSVSSSHASAAFQSPSTPRRLGSAVRNGGSGRPLLSRTEASLLLRVQGLAQEVDILTEVATDALAQRVRERTFAVSLERSDHPYLRPLLAILHVVHETLPTQAMQRVSHTMEQRVLPEMRRIVTQIRQCSEHNWTLADTLEDTAGNGNVLAEEKRQLSDVQEEVCQRIESIFFQSNQISSTPSGSSSSQLSLSMKEYCDRLFQHPSTENGIPEAIGNHKPPLAPWDDPESTAMPKTLVGGREEEENEEVLDDELPPSMPASPVSSPEESPTLHQVTDATKKAIRLAATPASEPPATAMSRSTSRSVGCSSLRRCSSIQGSITMFQEEETVEEKENAPSQSSSCSRRSQRTPTSSSQRSSQQKQHRRFSSATSSPPRFSMPTTNSGVHGTTAASSEDEPPVSDDFFRSQGAAEVLSTLAKTSIARSTTVNTWQNGSSSPT
jgi:hypothetical protein